MEPPEPGGAPTSDLFFDALDDLPPPPDPEEILPSATTSPEHAGKPPAEEEEITSVRSPKAPPSSSSLRRRRPSYKPSTSADSNDPSSNSSGPSSDRWSRVLFAAKDQPTSNKADALSSTVTSSDQISKATDQGTESSARSAASTVEPPAVDAAPSPQSLLVSLAGFVIKAIFFQINLLVKSFAFPIWVLYWSYLLVKDPFGALRRGRDSLIRRLLWVPKILLERVSPLVGEQGKLVARLAWGCFWSFYVCFVLVGLLVMAFIAGGLLMGRVVEEPVQMVAELNFDYTKASPDALVPLVPGGCGGNGGAGWHGGWRPVPLNHKLQLTISLTLPESDYNRRLGVFQVRAEFLSTNGKVTSRSSQPCMLQFKSSYIRVIESFLKSGSLLAGYSSESQTLRLKLTGFTEGTEAIVCIRVILVQRAEYKPGAGIPEIYAAWSRLESELPLFKRIIWNWRKTVFVWISMGFFIWELLVVLVCCRPFVVPRVRPAGNPPSRT